MLCKAKAIVNRFRGIEIDEDITFRIVCMESRFIIRIKLAQSPNNIITSIQTDFFVARVGYGERTENKWLFQSDKAKFAQTYMILMFF